MMSILRNKGIVKPLAGRIPSGYTPPRWWRVVKSLMWLQLAAIVLIALSGCAAMQEKALQQQANSLAVRCGYFDFEGARRLTRLLGDGETNPVLLTGEEKSALACMETQARKDAVHDLERRANSAALMGLGLQLMSPPVSSNCTTTGSFVGGPMPIYNTTCR